MLYDPDMLSEIKNHILGLLKTKQVNLHAAVLKICKNNNKIILLFY